MPTQKSSYASYYLTVENWGFSRSISLSDAKYQDAPFDHHGKIILECTIDAPKIKGASTARISYFQASDRSAYAASREELGWEPKAVGSIEVRDGILRGTI